MGLKHELTQKAVGEELENFDKESMKPVDVTERNILPDTETLQVEKNRENLLKGVEEFSQKDLSHVQTAEPLSGAELLKQELSMKSIADDIKKEALNKELDTLDTDGSSGDSSPVGSSAGAAGLRNLLDGGERERRSSSEEWEKVSSEDIVDRNTSEC